MGDNVILAFLLLGLVHLLLMSLIFFFLIRKKSYGLSSPEFLYVLFSFLHIFSLLVFSLDKSLFQNYLRVDFDSNYEKIVLSIILKILIDLIYLTISICHKKPFLVGLYVLPYKVTGIDFNPRMGKILKLFGYLIAFLGLLLLFIGIERSGGLVFLWLNIAQRAILFEESGIFLLIAETLLQFSAFILYLYYIYNKKFYFSVFLILLFSISLALIGGRSPVIFLLYVIILTHFTFFSKFKFKLSFAVIFLCFLVLALGVGKLRESNALTLLKKSPQEFIVETLVELPRHVAPYFSKIRRDLVIINYFDEHSYWYGQQYYTLLTSVIPRVFYEDKPVIDGGRLVSAMRSSNNVSPVMKIDEVPKSGWPEGNMAGFMNFGYFGLILFTAVVSLLIKNLYLISKRYSYSLFFIYLFTVFLGPVGLDPYSIFRFIGYIGPIILMLLFFRFFIFLRDFMHSCRAKSYKWTGW
jgi:hypothetical protein